MYEEKKGWTDAINRLMARGYILEPIAHSCSDASGGHGCGGQTSTNRGPVMVRTSLAETGPTDRQRRRAARSEGERRRGREREEPD